MLRILPYIITSKYKHSPHFKNTLICWSAENTLVLLLHLAQLFHSILDVELTSDPVFFFLIFLILNTKYVIPLVSTIFRTRTLLHCPFKFVHYCCISANSLTDSQTIFKLISSLLCVDFKFELMIFRLYILINFSTNQQLFWYFNY